MTRALALAIAVLLCALAAAGVSAAPPIGVNVGVEDFWTNNGMWADAVGNFDDRGYSYLDGYLPGRYAVSWTGSGAPSITGVRSTFTVTGPNSGLFDLRFAQQGPGGDVFTLRTNGVSGLRIQAPDALPGTPFRKPFVDRLGALTAGGVVRYMDLLRTNDSAVASWADRNTSANQTAAAGIAYEHVAALSNVTRSNPWVTVPYGATDDHALQLARLLKAHLDPGLTVRLEYSNELWNGQFSQYAKNSAAAAADPRYTKPDAFGRAAQRAAERTRQLAGIFASVLGKDRLVVELGAQAANPYWAQTQLEWLKAAGVDLAGDRYRVAIAPYVPGDINGLGLTGAETREQIFARMGAYMNTTVAGWVRSHKALVDGYGIGLDAYEAHAGSFYLVGPGSAPNAALQSTIYAMQSDPRMGAFWRDYVAFWDRESGGGLFGAYGFVGKDNVHGQWYLLTDINGAVGTKEAAVLAAVPEPAGVVTLLVLLAVAGLWNRGRR